MKQQFITTRTSSLTAAPLRTGRGVLLVTLLLGVIFAPRVLAQPLLSSQRVMEGVEVFRDLEREHHYYYVPGDLVLGREQDGRPKFQLLQMRYTGTQLVGNQGDYGFVNLVQIGIERKPVSAARLRSIQNQLGPKATLDPLPVARLEAHLLLPQGQNDGRYQRAGGPAGLSGNGKGGDWTQRYFTVRLGPREAELLWEQVKRGQLAFNVPYAYYTNAVNDAAGEYQINGDSAMIADLDGVLKEIIQLDSTIAPHVVRSGAIPIALDVSRWPDLCRRIDLNEGAPPTWAFLAVRCYDFANALRPDLAMKSVEIEATGVTGGTVSLGKPIRFMAANTAEHSRQVRFPYAVDIREPYRYRVTEFTLEGEARRGNWTVASDWSSLLDLTTHPDEIPYRKHALEFEVDTAAYRAAGAEALRVRIWYERDGAPVRESIHWDLTEVSGSPWAFRRFFADKVSQVRYLSVVQSPEGPVASEPKTIGVDGYVYLRPISSLPTSN